MPIPEEVVYKPRRLEFAFQSSIPDVETTWIGDADSPRDEKLILTREQWLAYADMNREMESGKSEKEHCHRMLGYSDDVQPMQLEIGLSRCHDVLFPDEPQWESMGESRHHELYRSSRLLFQIESHDDMSFGRWGKLHFFIRNADLKNARFDRVWARAQ